MVECKIAGIPLEKYKIVLSNRALRIVTEQAELLAEEAEKKLSVKLLIDNDSAAAEDYEIIIGDTTHYNTEDKPSDGNYSIKVIGKKLIVTAGDDASLSGGVRKLKNLLFSGEAPASLEEGFSLEEAYVAGEDGYKYVWGDDFDGTELNRKLWKSQTPPYQTVSCLNTKCMGRKAEGCYVKDGSAVIFATHDPVTNDFAHRQISTKGTHIFLYGCMEFRAKLAPSPSAHAIWYVTGSLEGEEKQYPCAQEIDLLEDFGRSEVFAANVHRWWKKEDGTTGHTSLDGGEFSMAKRYTLGENEPPLCEDYHIYSFQWDPEKMNFCVYGKVFFSYDIKNDLDGLGTSAYHTPLITLFSTTVGAATYGKKWTEGDRDYYELLVDYVRLYQRDCDGGFSKEKQSD